jgi:hypothetical protein
MTWTIELAGERQNIATTIKAVANRPRTKTTSQTADWRESSCYPARRIPSSITMVRVGKPQKHHPFGLYGLDWHIESQARASIAGASSATARSRDVSDGCSKKPILNLNVLPSQDVGSATYD